MASAGSSMAASQSSLGGTASNIIDVEGAGEEAGHGVGNPKYFVKSLKHPILVYKGNIL